jgi:hypothetical protein
MPLSVRVEAGSPYSPAGQKRADDRGDGHGFECGAGEQVAGVVIEEVQDLGIGPVGQGPVGEVGLPGFVGLVGLEAVQGGLGSLPRLGADEAGGVQDPADRRGGRRVQSFPFEVSGDRERAGVQSGVRQTDAQGQDPGGGVGACPAWVAVWAAGAWFDRVHAAVPVSVEQIVDPAAG